MPSTMGLTLPSGIGGGALPPLSCALAASGMSAATEKAAAVISNALIILGIAPPSSCTGCDRTLADVGQKGRAIPSRPSCLQGNCVCPSFPREGIDCTHKKQVHQNGLPAKRPRRRKP